MLAKDLLLLNKAGKNPHVQPSLILIPKNSENPIELLKGIVLEFVETNNGVQAVLNTSNDFNWNDAFNSIPDGFWYKYGVSFLDGTEVLLSGNVIEETVHEDENLLNEDRHVVVKEFEGISIVKLFATDENGVYGDIYNQEWHVRTEHQGENILEGFGILDNKTGYLLESTKDWYNTLEEAESDIPKTEKEVVDLTKFSGEELFDLVFPEPEEPDEDDFETEEEYKKAYEKYDEDYENYEEANSAYGIEEHPDVTEFESTNTDVDDWYTYTTYQFKKGKHYFEIEEESHVINGEGGLRKETFRIISH